MGQANIDANMHRQYQITGHIDGVIQTEINKQWVNLAVCDIKTCSPHVFDSMNSFEDLEKYPWTKKYRGQLYIYMLGMNIDKGCLIFCNKQNLYQMKTIWFELDYGYAEGLLCRAENINLHVKNETLPKSARKERNLAR
jgi:hypothetical protein